MKVFFLQPLVQLFQREILFKMAILSVGRGQQFSTLSEAVASSSNGDVITVQAGTYTNDFVTINTLVNIKSVGGVASFVATVPPPNGKAIMTTNVDVTVDGLSFSGAVVPDGNGAGIRYQGGHLTVLNSLFHDNENGLLGNAVPNGVITVRNSEFAHNGSGTGQTHNIYVGEIAKFEVSGSYFHDAVIGHEIKSRAHENIITDNRIQNGPDGTASYNIDLPNGGRGTVTNNVIEQGPNSENSQIVHFGGEGTAYADSSLTASGNTVINDNPSGSAHFVQNATPFTVQVSNNSVFGLVASQLVEGPATVAGNTYRTSAPALDSHPLVVDPAVSTSPAQGPVVPADVPTPPSGTVLHVGAGEQFATLAAALEASHDGDVVEVRAGTYLNDFSTANARVTIRSVGGMANFVATVPPTNGKGILTTNVDVTVDGLSFSGAAVADANGAGIRYQGGHLTVLNSFFHDNENGILGGAVADGVITIRNSEFAHNGNGNGSTHNLYVGNIAALDVQGSYFHDAVEGHEIKSRAQNNLITDNRIINGPEGTASYNIDLPNGGVGLVARNVIEQGALSPNSQIVHFGGEGATYPGSSLQLMGNTVINHSDSGSAHFVQNVTPGVVTLDGNTVFGLNSGNLVQGSARVSNTTYLASDPALDTHPLFIDSAVRPPAPPVVEPTVPGHAAVAPSGVTLAVGAGSQFATIAAAVAASHDGDVIAIRAGDYVNDFFTVNTKVTFHGVGGIANLIATVAPPNGKAIMTTNTDVVVDGLSFTGARVADQNGAGIRYQAGHLTVVNSFFHDNENGILGNADPKGTITIANSEFAHNGNGNGYSHNLYVGDIAGLKVTGSYFHDAVEGHELKSRAQVNIITGNRIQNGPNGTASYNIDLPNGGKAIVQGNVIEQGASSPNSQIVHFGGEGTPYAGSSLNLSENLVLNHSTSGSAHFLQNATGVKAAVSGNDVFGLDAGNLVAGPASVTGTDYLVRDVPLETSSPWRTPVAVPNSGTDSTPTPTPTPVPTPAQPGNVVGSGPDTLELKLSEDAYMGHAQFAVRVDGVQIGGLQTVTAAHGSATQTLLVKGDWGFGNHLVDVNFVNDAWTPGVGDRNLYVESALYNGKAVGNAGLAIFAGSESVGTGPDVLSLQVSADVGKGTATYTVVVDGKLVGTFTADAQHAIGAYETLDVHGDWGTGAHQVVITSTNVPLTEGQFFDHNVWIDALAYDGKQQPVFKHEIGQATWTVGDATAAGMPVPGGIIGTSYFGFQDVSTLTEPVPTPGSGVDTLVLKLTEDAYKGDALVEIFVDGKQVGGDYTIHAIRGTTPETLELTGNWSLGVHEVEVRFLNDAFGGTGATDRNAILESALYNNVPVTNAQGIIYAGSLIFIVDDQAAPSAATSQYDLMIA